MRARKPCVRLRLVRLGWKVIFPTLGMACSAFRGHRCRPAQGFCCPAKKGARHTHAKRPSQIRSAQPPSGGLSGLVEGLAWVRESLPRVAADVAATKLAEQRAHRLDGGR